MRTRLAAGLGIIVLGGGVALAVQEDDTACERYRAAVERQDYAAFEEAQRAQADAAAECMAEEATSDG